MEKDLIEAKKYLSQQGYGSGTNYTTNLVAELLANYAEEQLKKNRLDTVSKSFPDHYAGELNTERIKAYRLLHEQYNLDEGTVRDIFCKGADWYKEKCDNANTSR